MPGAYGVAVIAENSFCGDLNYNARAVSLLLCYRLTTAAYARNHAASFQLITISKFLVDENVIES